MPLDANYALTRRRDANARDDTSDCVTSLNINFLTVTTVLPPLSADNRAHDPLIYTNLEDHAYAGSMELNILSEDEPTTLEYARFYGLCTNYALENPLYPITPPLLDEAFDQDFNDPPDAPPVTNPANELTKERLVVNKETALLLRSVYLLSEPLDELQLISDGMRHIVNSKQEVALLRSDNELDMLHFGNTETPRLDDLRIPLESVDNENDEGLEWPSRYAAYPTRCYEQVKVEKLEVPKETLFYLQRNIRDHFEPSDVEKIVTEVLTCKRVRGAVTATHWLINAEHTFTAPDSAAASFDATDDTLHPIISYEQPAASLGRFKLYCC